MIAHESPDAAHFGQMALDLERPAFESGLPLPQQFLVTMNVSSIDVVFRCIIPEQTQVEKVGGARKEFEWRKVAFVERAGIGPDPADTIFFQKTDDLRSMPPGMPKFNSETKTPRQLFEKFTKCPLSVPWPKRRRKLDQDNLELWREWLDRATERIYFGAAFAQPARMRDLAGDLTGGT